MSNVFDRIAQPVASTKKSDKIAADVTAEVKAAVDAFVQAKAEIKRLEAEQKDNEALIIEHVRPQQDELAFCGQFTKSLLVPGTVSEVTYVTSDRFSVPQDADSITALKKVTGKKFNEMFEVKRSITMSETAIKNETILDRISAACEKAGFSTEELRTIFIVGDKVVAKDDLDKMQYGLTKDKLEVFRTLVRQNKPALK